MTAGKGMETVPEGARRAFEEWSVGVAAELDPAASVSRYGDALAFLLSDEALGPVEEYGRELPGYYVAGYDRPGKEAAGTDLLHHLYANTWRPEGGAAEDGTRLRVYAGCDVDDDAGWVHGLDVAPREGFPCGLVLFLEEHVDLTDLACRTGEDLYDVYRLTLGSGA